MKILYCFLYSYLLMCLNANAQIYCLKNFFVIENFDSMTAVMIENMPDADFYYFGETHNIYANHALLMSLIEPMHKKGVYNIVNELPQVTCFLFNEYLENGDTTLLLKIQPKATYSVLKVIRDFNLKQPTDKRFRFYGIDYIDQNDAQNMNVVIDIIQRKHSTITATKLNIFLVAYNEKKAVKDNYSKSDLDTLFSAIKTELEGADAQNYRAILGNDYVELLMMNQNWIGSKKRNDDKIFAGFMTMYNLYFKSNAIANPPKFFGFYGSCHIVKGFANHLLNNEKSPVKHKTNIVSLMYLECLGDWHYRPEKLYSSDQYGGLGCAGIKKNEWNVLKAQLEKAPKNSIGLLVNQSSCLPLEKKYPKLDAVLIFKQFGNRRMNSWKFD